SVAFFGMAARGVPRSSTLIFVAPRNGMIGPHGSAGIRGFIQRRQDMDAAARIGGKVVPLIRASPTHRKKIRGWIGGVGHLDAAGLYGRMALKECAHQAAIPRPVMFGVTGGMDAHKTPSALNVSLQGALLIIVQYVP